MKNKKIIIGIVAVILAIIILSGIVIVATMRNSTKIGTINDEETSRVQDLVLEDNEYMHVELDASGDRVPVPNGFVGSKVAGENEIDTGYVIYEGEEEVNDSNVQTAQTTRNQYVWVPVPDISKFYGTDANGKRWGKLYNFTTGTSSDSTFDEVTGTYAYNWSESNGVMSITRTSRIDSYREPDVVTDNGEDYDIDSNLRTLGLGAETTHEFLMQLEKEFSKMIDSVEKYGGFYIGRYETGDLNQDVAVVQKGNTNISNLTWYTKYKKCKTLSDENNNIETSMIWVNQFDRTLMWLMECNAKDETTGKSKEEVIRDSTSWGNYRNATFTYTNSSGSTATKKQNSSTRIPTGSTEYTKANNIYDLAGNVYDSTMEAYSTDSRASRGGCYDRNGNVYQARNRASGDPYSSGNNVRLQGLTLHKVATKTPDGNAPVAFEPEA